MTVFDRIVEYYELNTKRETADEMLDRYRQRQERFARMNYFYETGQIAKAREVQTTMLNAAYSVPSSPAL